MWCSCLANIYCYEKHKDEYMNDEIFGNIITMIEKHFKNRVYNGVSISLFGGEPFCNFDDVYKFLLEVQKICKENNCSFACEATTNGVLVTPDRFEKLIRVGCTNYQISVDGVKETHDKHRVRVDGSGSWDIIMSNLKYMKKTSHMFKVIIRTNFDEEIIERAEEFYQYVKDNFDDDRFTIYYENIKKLGGENDKKLTSMSTVEKMVANISISELLERNNLKCELTESRSQPFGQMCPAIKHNSYGTDGQRFECDHPSELFFGSAHRRKQTELLCSFRYGNGKCIVDKRDGGKDNQPDHNSRKTVKGGGNRVKPRNPGI